MRKSRLNWWKAELGFTKLAELVGSVSVVEKKLRGATGKSGRTLNHFAEALSAFCDWACKRGLLPDNPLKNLTRFDGTPSLASRRRALTSAEIKKLLDACDDTRRLCYEVALTSGLRANELKRLTVANLDAQRGGLILDAAWTKNRKPGFQQLPASLLLKLSASAESKKKTAPLLRVAGNQSQSLAADLKRAGIPARTEEGKVDFHALRVAYTTLVLDAGATTHEGMALVRHSSPNLTLSTYGRTRNERLVSLVESVGAKVMA